MSKYGEKNDNQNIPYVSKHFGKPKRKTIRDGVAPPYKLLTPALTAKVSTTIAVWLGRYGTRL